MVCTGNRYVFNTYTLRTRKYFLEPAVEWILVEEKKECGGVEVNKGTMDSIAKCAKACSGVASMFIFGTNDFGKKRCNRKGCKCICEVEAAYDGTCNTKRHRGYRLYRYDTWGNYFHYNISFAFKSFDSDFIHLISVYNIRFIFL